MTQEIHEGALLNAILDAAVDAIVVSDAEGIILRANEATCKLFQYEPDEMIGKNVKMLMPSGMAQHHDGFISDYVATGKKKIIGIGRDVEGMRKDTSVFPLHLSVGRAKINGLYTFTGIMHDLTRREAIQEALSRSQRLDAIGQMTGGIAHDFNNLLTVVIGNLELLEMHGTNEKQAALIKDALESAELGADLTERLLVFARKSNLKPEKADLRDVCSDALAILKRTFGENFRISTEFDPAPSPVVIDRVQLQSALMNLALNARDAMKDKGELVVTISHVTIDDTYMAQEADVEQGNYVRLSVSDNGQGMDELTQKRAFEPFYTTKSENGGTGLGLAMVYGFVRQSGGHITLYSEPGIGSNFSLYFPIADNADLSATPASSTVEKNALPRGNGETVLVVEDNSKVRKLSLQRIQDLGFSTLEAVNGDDAYELLKTGVHVDLIFTDLVMPGTFNGYELAEKVSAEFPDIKILLTSAYSSNVVTDSLIGAKNFILLNKPYRQSNLAAQLHAMFHSDTTD